MVCGRGGSNAPADKLLEVVEQAGPLLESDDDDVRERAAFALGAACRHLDGPATTEVIKTWVVVAGTGGGSDADEWYGVHGRACALREVVCFVDDASLFGGAGLVAKTNKVPYLWVGVMCAWVWHVRAAV